jgi:alpha-beta hydrolase superfamily lysophospholipase
VPVTPTERAVTLRDGFRLAVRVWTPTVPPIGAVVIAHGLGEHAGRYEQLARDLSDAGWEVHAADQRGHGRTAGARGVIPATETIRDDLIDSLLFARETVAHGAAPRPVVLLGHSMGGAFAAWAIAHRPDAADALILSSPALRTDLSFVQRVMMHTMRRVAPDVTVGNGLNPAFVSRDPLVVAAYVNDPLVHDRVSARLAHAIMTAGDSARAAAARWTTPTLLLYAGADQLVNPRGSEEFASALPAPMVTARRFDLSYHEIFNEPDRQTAIDDVISWLRSRAGG